jgi:hypothetical protein
MKPTDRSERIKSHLPDAPPPTAQEMAVYRERFRKRMHREPMDFEENWMVALHQNDPDRRRKLASKNSQTDKG